MELASMFGYKGFPSYQADERLLYADLGIGIEIEAEGFAERHLRTSREVEDFEQYWTLKPDGSLRNGGIEFCSRVLFGADITKALQMMLPVADGLDFNWRAGIHIHTDVSKYSVNDLLKVFELYCVMEPLLFAWEGNHRETSNFCVPWYSCLTPVTQFVELALRAEREPRNAAGILQAITRVGKYTALNVAPITTQGSIEFRQMQSTPDVDKIINFINLCSAITRKPREMSAPAGDMLSRIGEEAFLTDVMELPFLTEVPNYQGLLWEGIATFNLIPALKKDIKVASLMEVDNFPLIEGEQS